MVQLLLGLRNLRLQSLFGLMQFLIELNDLVIEPIDFIFVATLFELLFELVNRAFQVLDVLLGAFDLVS